jgi:hypothetical protein
MTPGAKEADRAAFEEFTADEKRRADAPPLPPLEDLTPEQAFEHSDESLSELEKQLAVEQDPERHLEPSSRTTA